MAYVKNEEMFLLYSYVFFNWIIWCSNCRTNGRFSSRKRSQWRPFNNPRRGTGGHGGDCVGGHGGNGGHGGCGGISGVEVDMEEIQHANVKKNSRINIFDHDSHVC